VSVKLSADEPIDNMGGPWWFIQLWLNLYTHKAMGRDLRNSVFPSDFAGDAKATTCRCMSFGEAALAFPSSSTSRATTAQLFKSFYHGFNREGIIWFAYNDDEEFELPIFRFLNTNTDNKDTFDAIITPGILPISFHSGRSR